MGLIDLHCHSTASDGSFSPSKLAEAATEIGLSTLALTDHDTVEGLPEFWAACEGKGLQGLAGVELSLEHTGTMHLLGLNIEGYPTVPTALEELQSFRLKRNLQAVELLNQLGYQISWEEILEESGGGQAGRPHFASVLVTKGFFKSFDEAFDTLLDRGKPGYINKKRLSPFEGLASVIQAGWVPVLAHPVTLGLDSQQWPAFLESLTEAGLVGLEVYHPRHDLKTSEFFSKLAQDFSLVPTAGSDFHGANKPKIHLDWVKTNSPLGGDIIELLRAKRPKITTSSVADPRSGQIPQSRK